MAASDTTGGNPPAKHLVPGDTVCVTGASGYVGTHVVVAALEAGLKVRGTVRDPSDAAKCAHLWKLADELGARDRLELVAADLLKPGSFDEALQGCDGLAHVAAVARFSAKDRQREIVDPSIEGVDNVYRSAAKAGTVRAVVHTSSVAAIVRYGDARKGHVFTEDDWNIESQIPDDVYGYAKAAAERAAWAFTEALPEEGRWRLTTINPAIVIGPTYTRAHCRTSPQIIRDLMHGAFPACPPIFFGFVDAREVAWAHVRALMDGEAQGRFILCDAQCWLLDVADRLRSLYPGKRFPKGRLPGFVMKLVGVFDKRVELKLIRKILDNEVRYDSARSREVLGVTYRSFDDSLKDTVEAMLSGGWGRLR